MSSQIGDMIDIQFRGCSRCRLELTTFWCLRNSHSQFQTDFFHAQTARRGTILQKSNEPGK